MLEWSDQQRKENQLQITTFASAAKKVRKIRWSKSGRLHYGLKKKEQLREGKHEIVVIMKRSNELKNALQTILSHKFMLIENVIQSLLMSRILIGYLPNCLRPFKVRHHPRQKLLVLNDSEQPSTSQRVSRRSVQPTDWSLCIFCQRPSRHQLINIRSYNVNYPIMNNAKYDNKMMVQLAGVSDLMAAEGKYHKYCLKTFERTTARNAQKFYFLKCYRRLEWWS